MDVMTTTGGCRAAGHPIAGAEGEAIHLRSEAEMRQASKALREIFGRR